MFAWFGGGMLVVWPLLLNINKIYLFFLQVNYYYFGKKKRKVDGLERLSSLAFIISLVMFHYDQLIHYWPCLVCRLCLPFNGG